MRLHGVHILLPRERENVLSFNRVFWCLQETKPSGDGAEKKDGEYIKLKVIGQVRKVRFALQSRRALKRSAMVLKGGMVA